jgi:hypothetical protein
MCNADQMFVFYETDIRHILNTVITTMKPATKPDQRSLPADVTFYCARYAYNYHDSEFMESFLMAAFQKIRTAVTVSCPLSKKYL